MVGNDGGGDGMRPWSCPNPPGSRFLSSSSIPSSGIGRWDADARGTAPLLGGGSGISEHSIGKSGIKTVCPWIRKELGAIPKLGLSIKLG